VSESGRRAPPDADAVRLARQDSAEGDPKRLAEERVDDRVGRRRDVAPPDDRRRDVSVAEPPRETGRAQHGDDVDDEERGPEQRESEQNDSEHLGRLQYTPPRTVTPAYIIDVKTFKYKGRNT